MSLSFSIVEVLLSKYRLIRRRHVTEFLHSRDKELLRRWHHGGVLHKVAQHLDDVRDETAKAAVQLPLELRAAQVHRSARDVIEREHGSLRRGRIERPPHVRQRLVLPRDCDVRELAVKE